MPKLPIDVKKFKKIRFDKNSTTLKHVTDGHEIKISHAPLSEDIRSQLKSLPIHKFAEGGPVENVPTSSYDDQTAQQPHPPEKSNEPGFFEKRISDLKNPEFLAKSDYAQEARDKGYKEYEIEPLLNKDFPADTSESLPAPTTPQQPSFTQAPQQAAPTNPDPYGVNAYAQGMTGALGQQMAGQTQQLQAQGQLGKDTELAQQEKAKSDQKAYQDYVASRAPIEHQSKEIQNWLNSNPENAHRYIDNMSTGGKIKTAIGLLLGGIGAGLNHGPNMAAQFLQKQIDADIESQRSDIGTKKGLLAHNLQEGMNAREAYQMAKIQNNEILQSALGAASGKAQSAASLGMIKNVQGIIGQETEKLKHDLAIQKIQYGGAPGTDPAKLVPVLVPKEHQAKAFAEIEAAENTKRMSDSILKSFEGAAKSNTILKTGAGMVRTPADVYALHQAMQPTFKDLEGTVRQAAMDNTFKNITPMPGDSEATIQIKRNALHEYLQSKLSAPTARGYGIDLGKFGSTANQQPSANTNSMEGKIARAPGKPPLIMKGGKWVPFNG